MSICSTLTLMTVINQSAYRRGHSTETVVLKVYSDIAEVLDEGSTTGFIMFDLSVTFGVIDHPILLKSLAFLFGVKQKALI